MLVFDLEDTDAAEQALERELAEAGIPALVATTIGRRAPAAVRDDRRAGGRPGGGRRDASLRRSPPLMARSGPPPAARSPVGSLRRAFHEARCALEATSLADGDAPEVASYEDLGAFTLLLSLQDEDALRLYSDGLLEPDRAHRGRVRRRAPALARGVHRAQRQLGARGARALLPPAHAALPDPEDRGAHRPRPLAGHRPDRAVAGPAGEGAGGMRVAVLGAGGTIAPAIVRDLAESDEVEELLLLDIDEATRPGGRRSRTAAARPAPPAWTRAPSPAPKGRSLARSTGCGRPGQLRELPGQPRRDGRVPARRLPLPRPRRAVLDDRAAARARPPVRARRACWRSWAWARRPGKTNLMARMAAALQLRRTRGGGHRMSRSSRPAGATSTRRTGSASPTRCRLCSTS